MIGILRAILHAAPACSFILVLMLGLRAHAQSSVWRYFSAGFFESLPAEVRHLTPWDPDEGGPISPTLVATIRIESSLSGPSRVVYWEDGRWTPLGGLFDADITDVCLWDMDGVGPTPPRIVVAGEFLNIDGVSLRRLAWWNGAAWRAVGTGLPGATTVHSITSWDSDGAGPLRPRLVAVGKSTDPTYGGTMIWNGAAWSSLPIKPSPLGGVESVASWDPDGEGPVLPRLLYVGEFTRIGGIAANDIAVWDGVAWSTLPNWTSAEDSSLSIAFPWDQDGDGTTDLLVVAGSAVQSGIPQISLVAWNGVEWTTFGNDLIHLTKDIEIMRHSTQDGSSSLVVAARFPNDLDGNPECIRMWNGNEWQDMGAGADSTVFELARIDFDGPGNLSESVVSRGGFRIEPDDTVGFRTLAQFTQGKWARLYHPLNYNVNDACYWDPDGSGPMAAKAVVVGDFDFVGPYNAKNIVHWDSTEWKPLGSVREGFASAVTVVPGIAMNSDHDILAVAGLFAGTIDEGVILWNGESWVDSGLNEFARHVINVYGYHIRGIPNSILLAAHPDGVSAFDGTLWTLVAPRVPGLGSHKCLCLLDLDGSGAQPANLISHAETYESIWRWEGSSWVRLARVAWNSKSVQFDSDGLGPAPARLIVAGTSMRIDSVDLGSNVVAFDGAAWSPLGSVRGQIGDLIVSVDPDGVAPDTLLISGELSGIVPGVNVKLAAWNGSSWHAIDGIKIDLLNPWTDGYDFDYECAVHHDTGSTRLLLAGSSGGAEYAPVLPVITSAPAFQFVCEDRAAEIRVSIMPIVDASPLDCVWYRDDVPITHDVRVSSAGPQDGTCTLRVEEFSSADAGTYRLEVTNRFGTVTSESVVVDASSTCCPSDYNSDSLSDILDFLDFNEDFSACELQPAPCGTLGDPDFNGDTFVDIIDFLDFIESFSIGC